jgi:uncharacterized membrane protein
MDSRILGIIGGVLLVIGVFCPLIGVDVLGQSMNVSYIGSGTGTSWEGLVLILIGIAGIALAVLRKAKYLLILGVVAIAILAYDYFSFKSKLSEQLAGAGDAVKEQMENAISMKWGWIVLILGALALIAAGAMGRNAPLPGTNYGAAPPPYPPAR